MSALALEHFDAVLNAALSGTRDELQKLRSQAKRQLLFRCRCTWRRAR